MEAFNRLAVLSIILSVIGILNAALLGTSPRQDLNFVDLAKYDGYTAEQHYVTTEDGYILGVFHIPISEKCEASNGVIMFMHGLLLSGDDCIIPGPGKAHCYIYADNCYDVWVPNVRGSFYSRNHTNYNPNINPQFWDFSVDEMAVYDLPAVIDYVLEQTNETQISYIGHAQGFTSLLMLCLKKPEYNDKIKYGFGISPTAWLDHSRYLMVTIEALIAPPLTLIDGLLNVEVLPRGGLTQTLAEVLCGTTDLSYPPCSVFIFAALGYNRFQITSDVLPVIAGKTPSGTSLKNFARFGQIKNNGFSEYDYGLLQNLIVYKQATPPLYDLSKVTMPWVLIGSENDYVADVTDIKYLVPKLQNVSLCVLSDTTFGHLDFIYGKDIPNYITPIVLSTLATGSYKCT